ncbi:MAG: hypothetical protein ABI042_05605 [Verrucomicrobiota bacterium]
MGAWSTAILGDDSAADVYGEFIENYNDGKELSAIRRELEAKNKSELNDPDEGPIFWLAIAKAQWDCGSLDSDVLAKVGEIVNHGLGLDRWSEGTVRDLEKRKKVLSEFYTKLQTPNPKPKKRKKPRFIPAVFETGDCLALHLTSGGYGAALVLATDNTHKQYGKNLIGVLRYRSGQKPPLSVFESRDWLYINHHNWKNQIEITWCLGYAYRKHKVPIEKIGSNKIRWLDPKDAKSFSPWDWLANQVELQFDWEAGKRD